MVIDIGKVSGSIPGRVGNFILSKASKLAWVPTRLFIQWVLVGSTFTGVNFEAGH
jgi:hypothetical protein